MNARQIGPYSPVAEAGPWLVVSGQLGVRDGVLVPGGAGAETTQAIVNLGALLAAHGAGLEDVVKTTVFMTDMENYGVVNEAYAAAFAGHWPARSAIAVLGLPMGSAVEIEAWAYRPVGPPL